MSDAEKLKNYFHGSNWCFRAKIKYKIISRGNTLILPYSRTIWNRKYNFWMKTKQFKTTHNNFIHESAKSAATLYNRTQRVIYNQLIRFENISFSINEHSSMCSLLWGLVRVLPRKKMWASIHFDISSGDSIFFLLSNSKFRPFALCVNAFQHFQFAYILCVTISSTFKCCSILDDELRSYARWVGAVRKKLYN